jgi:hypothetical protein
LAAAIATPRTLPPSTAAPEPCVFFARGACTKGAACRFSHDASLAAAPPPPSKDTDDLSEKDFSRTIAGAHVEFGDGASVTSVLLTSDYSAARIAGIPSRDDPAGAVRNIVRRHGFAIADDDVHLHPGTPPSATVRCRDKGFAKAVCSGGWTWTGGAGPAVQATPVAAPMPSKHSARRLDCKKVHLSWHKPSVDMWLLLPSLAMGQRGHAARLAKLFSEGTYTILGQKVRAEVERGALRDTVKLVGAPPATHDQVCAGIPADYHKPCSIRMGPPSYEADPEDASVIVRSLLTSIGPLEYYEETLESTARRFKATARFLDQDDAKRAADTLKSADLPFADGAKLTISLVFSAKFKVGMGVYDAVQGRVAERAAEWKAKNMSFYAYPSTDALRRFRVLKIEAEDAEAVVAARAELDDILAGVVVADDNGIPLWDSSLRANGELHRQIMTIAKKRRTIILRDKVRGELRIFGAKTPCAFATAEIMGLLKQADRHVELAVALSPEDLRWACRGGARLVLAEIAGRVVFDVVGQRFVVWGSLADLVRVQKMVTDRVGGGGGGGASSAGRGTRQPPATATTSSECPVCFTPAENPVQTPCGHVYCGECFENSCVGAPASAAGLRVACMGDACACDTPLPLAFLHDHLASNVFDGLLDRSFAQYVLRRPTELRFCPTPRCGHVHRVVADPPVERSCDGCFARSCSGCSAERAHPGYSCAEWRAARAGTDAGTRRLYAELGIKNCPRCGVGIEKTEGCNHMTCPTCQTHMCWVCLQMFATGNDVYGHMARVHGSHA